MVDDTGLEKERHPNTGFHKTLYVLVSLDFMQCAFHAVLLLVITFHQNNDQTMTSFQARFFCPNFTGSASARASLARAWAVSKVWAYIFSVVEVCEWPRAAETDRTFSPL